MILASNSLEPVMTSWKKVGREKYLNDCPTCGFSKHSGQRVLGATAKLTKWSDVHLCHGPRPQVIDKHCLDQPGHSAKRFINRMYLLFLSQVRKFWTPHLLFLYVSYFLIDFSSFWTSAIIIFKIAWHVVIWRKISRAIFSNLFILIVVIEKTWKNPISKR